MPAEGCAAVALGRFVADQKAELECFGQADVLELRGG
jgi:hypothetical protein